MSAIIASKINNLGKVISTIEGITTTCLDSHNNQGCNNIIG